MLRSRRIVLLALLSTFLAATCGGESTTGPSTGWITVSLHVTGEDVPAAATVAVDDGETRSIPADGSVTFADLPRGEHSVLVSGIPSNCTATTPNPAVVAVAGGETSPVDVSIGCAANVGSIEVSVWTNGEDLDQDGYVVAVPGADPQPLPTTGSAMLTGVPVGTNMVTISDVAPNCEVLDGESFEVVVAYGETATTGVSVSCYISQARIVFASRRPQWDRIYMVDPDGTDLRELIESRSSLRDPVWSPDGQRIAFISLGENNIAKIHMLRADGTDTGLILERIGHFYELSWSPDGSKLVFVWDRDGPEFFDDEVVVVNADLTGLVNVSNNPAGGDGSSPPPIWSPDGSQIFFDYHGHGPAVVNSDGTGLTFLTFEEADALDPHWIPENLETIPDGFFGPVWSPDWTRLAMTSVSGYDLYVMNADGSDLRLVADRVHESNAYPSWSPDSEQIAYWDNSGTPADVFVVDIAGGIPTRIASAESTYIEPDWGPGLR